jgi:hypothetical protein
MPGALPSLLNMFSWHSLSTGRTSFMWDFRFSWQQVWRLQSFGMLTLCSLMEVHWHFRSAHQGDE